VRATTLCNQRTEKNDNKNEMAVQAIAKPLKQHTRGKAIYASDTVDQFVNVVIANVNFC